MVLIGSEGEAEALDIDVFDANDIESLHDGVLPFRAVPDLDEGGSVPLVDEAVPCGRHLLDGHIARLGGGDVDGGPVLLAGVQVNALSCLCSRTEYWKSTAGSGSTGGAIFLASNARE